MSHHASVIFVKRYLLLSFGLALMALGIDFSVKAKLGTSPISSLPYVVSLLFPLTLGQATVAMNCALLLIQIALLRRNFELVLLAQFPIGALFGYMIDIGMKSLAWIECSAYWSLWLLAVLGIIILGTGVAFVVASGAVPVPGEATVIAFSRVLGATFPRTKICFDASLVVLAIILSFSLTGRVVGVREGTLAAAICVGVIVKYANRFVIPTAKRFLS